MAETADKGLSAAELEAMVADNDAGARNPKGAVGSLIAWTAFAWSLFQLYTASNIPFTLSEYFGNWVILTGTQVRQFHLAFAFFLAFLAYPAFKRSPKDRIPAIDWVLAGLGVACCLYLYFAQNDIASWAGRELKPEHYFVSAVGIVVLLLATFRTLGLPMVVVATVFLLYVFFGNSDLLPEAVQWKGASLGKALWHMWMQSEGVFGAALGVSASFIFLFVLFGSLLDKAGAGNYFIKVSFAALGHMRGGPAKAAVVSSAMTGLVSGSSIANVVTTGVFTIPLMKRVGFSPEKAGSVEVASSVNGQIMPPVMGAAAFLMVEYVGISYVEVIKHAFLPAVISYIALVYIVHLEALKAGMQGLPRPGVPKTAAQALMGFVGGFAGIAALALLIYYGFGWVKTALPDQSFAIAVIVVSIAYLGLIRLAAQRPDLEVDDPNSPIESLPELGPTVMTGLYFLVPIVILVWCLVIERFSPGLAAFWATIAMLVVLFTQRPIKAMLRGEGGAFTTGLLQGLIDIREGMIAGARNMIGIAIATGTAGIIVGTVSLTGFHQVIGEFIEFLAGGNLILMLVFVAIMSIILGMGLPTTANYIVVSSLMAGVVVELGAQQGLIVPLIAVHLFVFYFGLMADVTPPVGLASFAAAAVSRGDPLKTGFTAFWYSLRTATLPFLFLFNTQLLLIGIEGPLHLILVVVTAVIAMLVFAAGTMGYFFAKSRLWESAALLLIAFTLFRPGFWMDMIYPPFEEKSPLELVEIAGDPALESVVLEVAGETIEGDFVQKQVIFPLGEGASGEERLMASGLEVRVEDEKLWIDNVDFASQAEKLGLDFDWEIQKLLQPADRPAKKWMTIPAFLLLGLIIWIQRRRGDPRYAAGPQRAAA